ncbi:hypothetical protein B0H10DRAFT_1188278 [Mycena sp. CBHHK59/15]|nr:hypothetical protein B0H10DRAFT_1188278 [Mycena sp. CBHHK59/15]
MYVERVHIHGRRGRRHGEIRGALLAYACIYAGKGRGVAEAREGGEKKGGGVEGSKKGTIAGQVRWVAGYGYTTHQNLRRDDPELRDEIRPCRKIRDETYAKGAKAKNVKHSKDQRKKEEGRRKTARQGSKKEERKEKKTLTKHATQIRGQHPDLHNQAVHLIARPFPISIVLLPGATTNCVPDRSRRFGQRRCIRRSRSRRRRRRGRGRRHSEV